MLAELLDLLRIPSVSTGEPNHDALHEAATFFADKVRKAGGTCDLMDAGGNPLVVGDLRANRSNAATVLIYGHYDVQSPGPMEQWRSDPFEPEIRDGRLYARGASDDKGNFWPLLYTACDLAGRNELPVNVRVIVEGEEETGSRSLTRWFETDDRGADCAIVFDSGGYDVATPAITLGARGVYQVTVTTRVADLDLHSGVFGGSVLNAAHELVRVLTPILPKPDGILRDELRAGIEPVPDIEHRSWDRLPRGGFVLDASGGRPLDDGSADRYYRQNVSEPSIDVTELRSGEPRTIVPAVARAHVTMRLAPGQKHYDMADVLKRLIRETAHPRADVEFSDEIGVDAASFDVSSPPLRLAREAFAAANGVEPLLVRLGASIPILSLFQQRGIQTIVSGFATMFDGFHAPNESYALEGLDRGAATARELYARLAAL
jgi:acetylornithine deacetylase/succinyl-diaminopimelate desuccinylase-like protein